MKKLLTLTGAALVLSSSFAMAENQSFIVDNLQQDVVKNATPVEVNYGTQSDSRNPLIDNNKRNVSFQYDSSDENGRNSDQ